MPNVFAQGKVIACNRGDNLRKLLLDNNVNLYNGNASIINCHGIGTCGTCAVMVAGVADVNWQDKTRRLLRFLLILLQKICAWLVKSRF